MKIKIGFSPCPNDTYIFDALINKKIDTGHIEFEAVLEDVETLNEWCHLGKLDVSKLSFPAVFQTLDDYTILDSGAALGNGVGPLLVARKMADVSTLHQSKVAIPGLHTTANFLLTFAFPALQHKIAMRFDQIENAVLQEQADLGLIIHENRFTYLEKGLVKICDLGEVWEEKQQLPIPLGCIAAKRALPEDVQRKIETLIGESLQYARQQRAIPEFVRQHAQEMNEQVMRSHIDLYVNEFTASLGDTGRAAVKKLYEVYCQVTQSDPRPSSLFRS